MTAGSTVHIMIPFIAAWFGSNAVIGCRAFQGLNQGFLYPLLHNLLSKWTPTPERSVVSGIVYSGSSLGIAISMVFTGSISQSSYGWPAAFYIYGGLGLLMAFLFACFIANTPSSHPSITEEEKSYIENTTFVTKKSKVRSEYSTLQIKFKLLFLDNIFSVEVFCNIFTPMGSFSHCLWTVLGNIYSYD